MEEPLSITRPTPEVQTEARRSFTDVESAITSTLAFIGLLFAVVSVWPPESPVWKFLAYRALLPTAALIWILTLPWIRRALFEVDQLLAPGVRVGLAFCLQLAVAGWVYFLYQTAPSEQQAAARQALAYAFFGAIALAPPASIDLPVVAAEDKTTAVPVDALKPLESPETQRLREELTAQFEQQLKKQAEQFQRQLQRMQQRPTANDPVPSSVLANPPDLALRIAPAADTACSLIGKGDARLTDGERNFLNGVGSFTRSTEGLVNRLVYAEPTDEARVLSEIRSWLNGVENHVRGHLGPSEVVDVTRYRSDHALERVPAGRREKLTETAVNELRRVAGTMSCVAAIESNLRTRPQ